MSRQKSTPVLDSIIGEVYAASALVETVRDLASQLSDDTREVTASTMGNVSRTLTVAAEIIGGIIEGLEQIEMGKSRA